MAEEVRHCGTCKYYGIRCDKCNDHDLWEPEVIDVLPGMVIKLELDDESCMSVANAICNYCVNRMGDDETALIFMEELTEHIDSAVRAKKKWLEYQKSKEE